MQTVSSHVTTLDRPPTAADVSLGGHAGGHSSALMIGGTAAVIVLLLGTYWSGLRQMAHQWLSDETYSHGLLVPWIAAYLIWKRRHVVAAAPATGQAWGVLPLGLGSVLYLLGETGALYILIQVSLWLVGTGLLITSQGIPRTRRLIFPLCYLLTAIPLPQFLYQGLSHRMQLLSSAVGVGWLQLIGITAFREGNVIDLGPIQLQVVEACSGLRYLFPLFALALLCGYLYRGRPWQRIVLVLSSLPISVLLNGFRIGVVGLLVEALGPTAAEGFLHLFEGWMIFLASVVLLWLEILTLNHLGPERGPMSRPAESVPSVPSDASVPTRRMYAIAIGLIILMAVTAGYTVTREEEIPVRRSFVDFPMQMGEWTGSSFALEQQYRDALKFDDYLLADYRTAASRPVTFYAAYYHSQRKGQSVHSPQSCIPSGGWDIAELEQRSLFSAQSDSRVMTVNRVVITKAQQRQIVYYWFKQRNHTISNEYLVKGYLIWDAIARHRTDGALVRLSAAVEPGEPESSTDDRLVRLAAHIMPVLDQYVPD